MTRRTGWPAAFLLAVATAAAAASIWTATVLADPAVAEPAPETVTVWGRSHDGIGRLVFEWPAPIRYSVRLEGDSVILVFARPAVLTLDPALAELRDYIRAADVAENGRRVTLRLAGDYGLDHFTDGIRIALDLIAPKTEGLIAPKTGETTAEGRTVATDPPFAAGPAIPVRVGEHPGFSRLVFDWTAPVAYNLTHSGDTAVLRFQRPRSLDLRKVHKDQPTRLRAIEILPEGDVTAVRLTVAPGVRLRNFRHGMKIVLDLLDPAGEPPATISPPPATPPAPTPPTPTSPASTPLTPTGAPTPLIPVTPQPAPQPTPRPTPAAATSAATSPPAAVDMGEATDKVSVRVTTDADGVILRFAWPTPVSAAAFRRAGSYWLVFDQPTRFDLREVTAANHPFLGRVVQRASGSAAVLLFTTGADAAPRLSRDGTHWIVDFRSRVRGPDRLIAQRVESRPSEGVRLLLPVRGAGEAVWLEDPEVGDRIAVVPVPDAGLGLAEGRDWPEFQLLPTIQGVAVVPRADDLIVRSVAEGVSIGSATGLLASNAMTRHAAADRGPEEVAHRPVPERFQVRLPESAPEGVPESVAERSREQNYWALRRPRLFDLPAWRRNGPETFTLARQELQRAVIEVPAVRQDLARRNLARFFFAHGLAAEAAGVLDLIRRESPGRMRDPELLLLSGASAVLMGDTREADRILANKSLDGEPEAMLWRAALAGALGNWGAAAQAFEKTAGLIDDYPKVVRFRLRLLAAEALIEAGDPIGALAPLDAMREDSPDADQLAQIAFLDGRRAAVEGRPVEAREVWQALANNPHQPSRARAVLELTEMMLEHGEITRAEAIDRLEQVRFMWRGGPFEFTVLRRLGQLYLTEDKPRDGLSILRQAASNFPDHPRVDAVTQEMAEAFRQLYLGGGADRLSPLSAVALFQEFRELTPSGAEGDAMIAALADRLVAVDLLGRAAALLEEQVKFRLSGLEKARTGTRLAAIHLLHRQPAAALTALDASAVNAMPESLTRERQRLEAQALFETGRGVEALAKLEGDESHDAALLRADMLWRLREWAEAADAFAQLLSKSENMAEGGQGTAGARDRSVAQLVLNRAVALSLAGDRARLEGLAARYGALMADDPLGESFRILTAEAGAPSVTMPIAEQLAGVGALESFMAAYRDRLQTASLSGQE